MEDFFKISYGERDESDSMKIKSDRAQRIREQILKTAQDCIDKAGQERPEVRWLREKFAYIQEKYALKSRTQTDRFLYERMYGREADTPAAYLKIRYWRTGRYTPVNREQCRRLGEALELSTTDRWYLLQGYYDRRDVAYDSPADWESRKCRDQCAFLARLARDYLDRKTEAELSALKIRPEERHAYFRHVYFTDAFRYVKVPKERIMKSLGKHITSTRYDSELRRQMHLQGEIPRKTMLRHLFILNAPELTREKIDAQLVFLGYLPLCEEHTMAGGERLDLLLIRLLEGYAQVYDPGKPQESGAWLQETCRALDAFFEERGEPRMRFMHFKALEL